MGNMKVTRRDAVIGAAVAGLGMAVGSSADAQATGVLQTGARGPAVTALQRRLDALGYWCGEQDGIFGHTTGQAVLAVQKVAGLERDGIVGAATKRALDAGTRSKSRRGGDRIEVDKQHQVVLLVRAGRVVHTFNTSTGNGKPFDYRGRKLTAVTPSGEFRIFRCGSEAWDEGPLGGLWRPYYFNGGIALHGAHGIPAQAASHGCCRLSIPAQNYLIASKALFIGERVSVY